MGSRGGAVGAAAGTAGVAGGAGGAGVALVGTTGTAVGVTVMLEADTGPGPTAFSARTAKEYEVPSINPVT